MTPPLLLLGVARSGTTLLRVILDRSPGLAIPTESVFVPLLARRHGRTADAADFLDDLRRLPKLREWDVETEEVAKRLGPGMPTGDAVAAIYETYAAKAGKPRWGDKTPLYMRHLDVLTRLFPDAQYVHLVRDGRDAALSYLQMPEGTFSRTWANPASPAAFACQWRREVRAARALGAEVGSRRYLEVRYEDLVAEPEEVVRGICAFAAIPFAPAMLEYAGEVDVSAKPHHRRLLTPPTAGVRSWREEMRAEDVAAFEEVAGDLLRELGYPATRAPGARGLARRAGYAGRLAAWNAATGLVQRSPLWRRRHPPL